MCLPWHGILVSKFKGSKLNPRALGHKGTANQSMFCVWANYARYLKGFRSSAVCAVTSARPSHRFLTLNANEVISERK